MSNDFRPSQGLILEVAQATAKRAPRLARDGNQQPGRLHRKRKLTIGPFVRRCLGKACDGWALYVAGRFNVERLGTTKSSDPTDLREDVKFTELVAAML